LSIMIYGDSNSWGFDPSTLPGSLMRIPYNKRWATLLQSKLGNKEQVIVEALNARTSLFDDPCSPCDGEYDCNGRRYLTTLLHSHKPLKVVILALGTNDLKAKFNTSHHDIASGIRALVRDIKKASNIGVTASENPKILILAPPIILSTQVSKIWGFVDVVDIKSKKLSILLTDIAKEINCECINLSNIAKVSELDGVHFDESQQEVIASAVYAKLQNMI